MLKLYKFIGLFIIFIFSYSSAVSVMCDVIPGYACLVCVVMRY